MKELEVGMYIRYVPTLGGYTQKISKITKTKNCLLDMAYYLDNEKEPVFSSYFDYILKSSYNLIDLIEVGDYVNGYKVYEADKVCHRITLNGSDDGNEFRLTYLRPALGKNMGIKSIVTKEQFDSMKYVVGDR